MNWILDFGLDFGPDIFGPDIFRPDFGPDFWTRFWTGYFGPNFRPMFGLDFGPDFRTSFLDRISDRIFGPDFGPDFGPNVLPLLISNFIKLFGGDLLCEFIRTFFSGDWTSKCGKTVFTALDIEKEGVVGDGWDNYVLRQNLF